MSIINSKFKNRLTIFISMFLVAFTLNSNISLTAANADFNVITTKGETQVKRVSGKDWENIKSGDKLFTDDQVKIGNNGYLGLLHSTGAALELNKSGNYTVKKLVSQATSQKSDVTKKFTKYLVEELKGSDDVLNSGDYRKKMKNLGAVERAMDKGAMAIQGGIPLNTYSIDNLIKFTWKKIDGANDYTFNFKNSDGKIILTKSVNGTSLDLDIKSMNLKSDECYFWYVSANNINSEEYCLFNYNTNDKTQIENDLKTIETEIGTENTAMLSMVKASYYEDKNITYKANEEYLNAINNAPDNSNYKVLYAKFLVKLGLTQEAEEILK